MSASADIQIDTKGFPLVEVGYPRTLTDDALERFLQSLDKLLRRPTPFVLLVDSNDCHLTPRQHARLAEHMHRSDTSLVLCAVVLPSAVARCIMTALLWLASPPTEMRSFGTIAEARSHCVARLRAGVLADPRRSRGAVEGEGEGR
jgi:hypothetical protein